MSSDTPSSAPTPPAPDAKKDTPPPPKPAPRGTRGRLIAVAALAAVTAGGYLYWKLQQQAMRPPALGRYETVDTATLDSAPVAPETALAPAESAVPPAPPERDAAAASTHDASDEVTPFETPSPGVLVPAPLESAPAAMAADIEGRVAALETQLATLAAARIAMDAQALALGAAGELVALAEQRLLLARDTSGAMAALRLAASRLASGEFPAQRRALLADLAALEAFRDVDVTALAAELATFARAAPTLHFAALAPLAAAATPTPVEGWRGVVAAVWASLRGLVEVRDADETRDPLLNPAHAALARQQLALDLSAARVAVLERDATAFRAALSPAIEDLAGRFDPLDPVVASTLARLRAMSEVDLAPLLPTLTRSVDALAAAPVVSVPTAVSSALPPGQPALPDALPAPQPAPELPDAPAAETAL